MIENHSNPELTSYLEMKDQSDKSKHFNDYHVLNLDVIKLG